MVNKFNYLSFIEKIISFSPRQLNGEIETADFLVSFLREHQISYSLQKFRATVPVIERAVLKLDGKEIKSEGCSFVGGKIKDKEMIISSLISSQLFLTYPNINFNPKCPDISLSNFYFAPAFAVAPVQLLKIIKAKKVAGEVKVRQRKYTASNILIGQTVNPQVICFAHYDSVKKGATDNASGVAVMTNVILAYPELLQKVLYVFSANEELSYDRPIYWGYGFRVFEDKFSPLIKKAKKIIVVDCVGNGKTKITQDKKIISLSFPIKNIKSWQNKIFSIHGDIERLMAVYHSDLDDLKEIKERYLKEASQALYREVSV